ncbi:MAG: hypothetical protein ARM1_0618 [Candidatus Micrarchaeota archaeon]|nr:MAG: hypothetical protein ARM1_0618 [Candidatus Micrarchaeota archaeon]
MLTGFNRLAISYCSLAIILLSLRLLDAYIIINSISLFYIMRLN